VGTLIQGRESRLEKGRNVASPPRIASTSQHSSSRLPHITRSTFFSCLALFSLRLSFNAISIWVLRQRREQRAPCRPVRRNPRLLFGAGRCLPRHLQPNNEDEAARPLVLPRAMLASLPLPIPQQQDSVHTVVAFALTIRPHRKVHLRP
jgi:hypothetical protein